jgi:hypothetical protein
VQDVPVETCGTLRQVGYGRRVNPNANNFRGGKTWNDLEGEGEKDLRGTFGPMSSQCLWGIREFDAAWFSIVEIGMWPSLEIVLSNKYQWARGPCNKPFSYLHMSRRTFSECKHFSCNFCSIVHSRLKEMPVESKRCERYVIPVQVLMTCPILCLGTLEVNLSGFKPKKR